MIEKFDTGWQVLLIIRDVKVYIREDMILWGGALILVMPKNAERGEGAFVFWDVG